MILTMTKVNVLHAALAFMGTLAIAIYIIAYEPYELEEPKRKKRKKGNVPGLANMGNTCFLNCILQALASCSFYNKWLMLQESTDGAVLLSSLQNALKILNNECSEEEANSLAVLNALREHRWVISMDEQDAHELFHALSSTIDEELSTIHQQSQSLLNLSWISKDSQTIGNSECNKGINEPLSTDEDTDQLSLTSHSSNISKNCSIISRISSNLLVRSDDSSISLQTKLDSPFKGKLASTLQCTCCGYKNGEQWNVFESISLTLPPKSTSCYQWNLHTLLQSYVRPENVSEVTCNGCTGTAGFTIKRSFIKQTTIGKLPESLCIHIQRNTWNSDFGNFKRSDHVVIPEILNMDPFTYNVNIQEKSTDIMQPVILATSLTDLCNDMVTRPMNSNINYQFRANNQYRLQAVIVHVGSHFSGHFVTYRRGSIHSNSRERWFYTSDLIVKEVTLNEVLQSNAYMILYEKLASS